MSGLELTTNPVDLLGVYITCVSFTFPFIIATESLKWTHNAFHHTASPIDYEIYMIFNEGQLLILPVSQYIILSCNVTTMSSIKIDQI